jgi:hypothetical protein
MGSEHKIGRLQFRLAWAKCKIVSQNKEQNIKKDWRYGSRGIVCTLEVQSPELKNQYHKKEGRKKESKRERRKVLLRGVIYRTEPEHG